MTLSDYRLTPAGAEGRRASGERLGGRGRRRGSRRSPSSDHARAGNLGQRRASNRASNGARSPGYLAAERECPATWLTQVGGVTAVPTSTEWCRPLILLIVDKTYQFKKLIKSGTAVTAVTATDTGYLCEIKKLAWALCPKPIQVRSIEASQRWSILTIGRHSTSTLTLSFCVPYRSYFFGRGDSVFVVFVNDYKHLARCQQTGCCATVGGVGYA